MSTKPLKKIKSTAISRSMSLARLTLKTGMRLAKQKILDPLQEQGIRQENWRKLIQNQSEALSREFGELKGSLMKAGQLLSIYGEHFLPPEANQFLKTLQSDSVPLSWDAIEKVIKKEAPPHFLKDLDIDPIPIGTASLGQVHRAKIKKTGEWLALKIQYPNVDRAIQSDLKTLKRLLILLKLIPRDFDLTPLFDEIESMLLQETNYEIEAQLTEAFSKKLLNDNRYIVPKVYKNYSNKRILVTSFEEGLRVDAPEIQQLSQKRRDRLSLNFLELFFKEFYLWKTVQTDPHIGNYRIRINSNSEDQLILFDFGATKTYPDHFIIPYQNMLRGAYLRDEKLFFKYAYKLGLVEKNDSEILKKKLIDIFYMVNEPFTRDTFNWKESDLPQRLGQLGFSMLRDFWFRPPPRELIFLDRKSVGVFVFLSILDAKVSGKKLLEEYLEKSQI